MEVIPYVNVATIPNTPKPTIKYKASEGVLKDLIPVFIDVETFMDKSAGISLSAQTLRQYIKSSYLTSIGIAIGDDDPEVVLTPEGVFAPEDSYVVDALRALALSKEHIFVCHNAAFDIRVLRFMLGIEQPQYVWCTMEGAMAAWPEFPGGYGLFNLGEGLNFPANERKLEIDLDAGNYTAEALKIYNGRDVICARTLYYRQIARFSWQEQRIAILTHNVRKFHFLVDSERLDALVLTLDANARTAEMAAKNVVMDKDDNDARLCIENGGMVSDDGIGADGLIVLDDAEICEVFNREDVDNPGMLKSVRGARLIKIIREKFGITLPTTSLKKLSPVWQAQHPKITELLRQTTRANKMISHGRRSKNLQNVPEVDVELGYFRAHTGRFSSPSQGKGLNLHNCPKHDVSIAKPVRQVFRLPPDKCFVRGDLANVEYRVEGWLTGCPSVMKMFDETLGGDRFSDPYIKGWETMTRQVITKKNPIRQVSKSATLGLAFCMSAFGYARVLLGVCSDPHSKVTEGSLRVMIKDLGWPLPSEQSMKMIIEKTGCSAAIAIASWNIHRLFNAAHLEFGMVADWLVNCVTQVAEVGRGRGIQGPDNMDRFIQAEKILRNMETASAAPDPAKLRLTIDDDYTANIPSVRVQCGPWPATVCWRKPAVRTNKMTNQGKPQLTILKANGLDKPFTRQLAIENVTQAAARNALCAGLLQLEDKYGTRDILHVHDEVLIITDRKREAILAAKQQLIDVFGPKAGHPLDWAILIKPEEISVTQSLWEEETDIMHFFDEQKQEWKGGDRWGKIERGDSDMLDNLP